MPKFQSQLKPLSPARLQQANRRGSRVSNPASAFSTIDAENFNFNTLNHIFYQGRRDRLQRYDAYDQMDMDADIHRALDIIAEHCTQKDAKTGVPFKINVENDIISHEDSETLFELMSIWNKQNDWDNLAFRTVRNTIKYGDFFFIRDPETFDLFPLSPRNVEGAYVDDEDSSIIGYMCVDLKKNFKFMQEVNTVSPAASQYRKGRFSYSAQQDKGKTYSGIFEAKDIVHISMSEGIEVGGNGQNADIWPFGESMLERIYKDYKARSLLEEAEVIHRIQRAPSRRVFYIDVGKTRPDKADSYARKVKNELMQKRIPSKSGGQDAIDSVYNPISQMEDLFLTVTADGRGTKVETLEGQAWSDEGPLKYFYNKMNKGLGIPNSYMAGPEDGGSVYNDGRVGTAYIQEGQFAKMCERIQDLFDNIFDLEFKLYLDFRGIHVNSGYFEVKFVEPMNFAEYREAELNETRLNLLSNALGLPFMSKRFAMKKFANWTDDEILDNEHQWSEENLGAIARQYDQQNELGGMGVGGTGLNTAFGGTDFTGGGFDTDFGAGELGGETGGTTSPGGLGGNIPGGTTSPGGLGGGNLGGGAGAAATPPGTESFRLNTNKQMLNEMMRSIQYSDNPNALKLLEEELKNMRIRQIVTEEDIELNADDLVAIPNRPEEKTEGPDDKLFYKDRETGDSVVKLSFIRKLRLERESNREALVARLLTLQKIYGSSDSGGGLGF